MEGSGEGFKWRRPDGMATSAFLEFTDEATARIGAGNAELLKDVDLAMNSAAKLPRFMDVPEEKARELAKEAGIAEERYFSYLAFLHEIAYRREFGPALWERRAGVTPCPDYLPPTSGQVREGRLPLFRLVNRLWNWALIFVIGGMFPFVILPLCGMKVFGVGFGGQSAMSRTAAAIIGLWLGALAVFAVCFAASRAMRTKRCGGGRA